MTTHAFTGTLERPAAAGSWTYVKVPARITKALDTSARVAVKGTINTVAFQGSVMPLGGGEHFIVVKKEIREAAGVTTGDSVKVTLQKDEGARTVEVPEALQAAMKKSVTARKAWSALSYSHQKEYADWISGAKKDETRVSRAAKAVAMLIDGKRLKG